MLFLQRAFYACIRLACLLCAVGFGLWAAFVFIRQVTAWAKYDIWVTYTVAAALKDMGISVPYTGWLGIEHLMRTALQWQGTLLIWTVGMVFFVGFIWANFSYEMVDRKIASAK